MRPRTARPITRSTAVVEVTPLTVDRLARPAQCRSSSPAGDVLPGAARDIRHGPRPLLVLGLRGVLDGRGEGRYRQPAVVGPEDLACRRDQVQPGLVLHAVAVGDPA